MMEGHQNLLLWATMPGEGPHSPSAVTIFQLEIIKQILLAIERVIWKLRSVCTLSTCPKMIASDEWHFLCAPHADKPRDCAAIDYMKHTVDSTSSLLLALVNESPHLLQKQYPPIIRRLYRIYGHLYFHHPDIFKEEFVTCSRFYHFLKQFGLFKQDMMIIPEYVFGGTASDAKPAAPQVVGTIVDLRTITMQLSEEDEEDQESDITVNTGVDM